MAEHVCPWYVGYLLASPLRRLWQKPEIILADFVKPGMTVMDVGCAMGFFSLPMAKMVGEKGRVVSVDLQEKMLSSLRRRAEKAGLLDRMEPRQCESDHLGIDDLSGKTDFALAFAVVHEVPSAESLIRDIHAALKPGGMLLLAEPSGHVTAGEYDVTRKIAKMVGFKTIGHPEIKRSHATLFQKE